MSGTSDAQRLLARGSTVTLAGGATHEIRFDARALAQIEDEYGSLEAFTGALRTKPFTSLAYVIHLTLGVPRDEAIDLIDTRQTHAYVTAISDAIEEALPPVDVRVRIIQNHEIAGDRYRAGTVVEVPSDRAKHLVGARVAEVVEGNAEAAPGPSPGAASSVSRSSAGTSARSSSGA